MRTDPVRTTVSRQTDAARTSQRFDGGAILIDYHVRLRDASGRSVELAGYVPEGTDLNSAVKAVVEQNGGVCRVERGKYDEVNKVDLSKLEWITHIVLSDGTAIENPHIGTFDGRALEIGKVGDCKYWENGQTKRATANDNRTFIEDGSALTAELPSIKGGGCSGAITQDDIDKLVQISDLLARGIVQKETYLFNRETGEITAAADCLKPPFEFVYRPDVFHETSYIVPAMSPDVISIQAMRQPASDRTSDFFYITEKMNSARQRLEGGMDAALVPAQYAGVSAKMAMDTYETKAIPQPNEIKLQEIVVPAGTGHQSERVTGQNTAPEESMIMRLLMNPVERKIWGRMYGLPDDEQKDERKEAVEKVHVSEDRKKNKDEESRTSRAGAFTPFDTVDFPAERQGAPKTGPFRTERNEESRPKTFFDKKDDGDAGPAGKGVKAKKKEKEKETAERKETDALKEHKKEEKREETKDELLKGGEGKDQKGKAPKAKGAKDKEEAAGNERKLPEKKEYGRKKDTHSDKAKPASGPRAGMKKDGDKKSQKTDLKMPEMNAKTGRKGNVPKAKGARKEKKTESPFSAGKRAQKKGPFLLGWLFSRSKGKKSRQKQSF